MWKRKAGVVLQMLVTPNVCILVANCILCVVIFLYFSQLLSRPAGRKLLLSIIVFPDFVLRRISSS